MITGTRLHKTKPLSKIYDQLKKTLEQSDNRLSNNISLIRCLHAYNQVLFTEYFVGIFSEPQTCSRARNAGYLPICAQPGLGEKAGTECYNHLVAINQFPHDEKALNAARSHTVTCIQQWFTQRWHSSERIQNNHLHQRNEGITVIVIPVSQLVNEQARFPSNPSSHSSLANSQSSLISTSEGKDNQSIFSRLGFSQQTLRTSLSNQRVGSISGSRNPNSPGRPYSISGHRGSISSTRSGRVPVGDVRGISIYKASSSLPSQSSDDLPTRSSSTLGQGDTSLMLVDNAETVLQSLISSIKHGHVVVLFRSATVDKDRFFSAVWKQVNVNLENFLATQHVYYKQCPNYMPSNADPIAEIRDDYYRVRRILSCGHEPDRRIKTTSSLSEFKQHKPIQTSPILTEEELIPIETINDLPAVIKAYHSQPATHASEGQPDSTAVQNEVPPSTNHKSKHGKKPARPRR